MASAGGQLRKEMALPNNYLDMVQRAMKPGLQNEIVTHSYAVELCTQMRHARSNSNQKYIDRMDSLREPGSTALLCAIPSAGLYRSRR